MKRGAQRGFTLLEILVALTVLAVTLAAIIKAAGDYTANQAYLRDRTLALYVASNAITELRLNAAFPEVGRSTDETTLADRRWQIVSVVAESGIEGLRRVDVTVSEADRPDVAIRTVAGFVSNRPPLSASAVPSFDDLGLPDGEIS